MNLDLLIFRAINNLAYKSPFLDGLAILFAKYSGYLLILTLFFLLIKNWKKYKNLVIASLIAAFISRFVIVEIIRHLYFRPRPFAENIVNFLIAHKPTASFPSGHTSFYFAISAVVFFYNKKLGLVFLLTSLLMGISRVYCGLHWPADILAGALIGIFVGWIMIKLTKKSQPLNNDFRLNSRFSN
jgi:undecaprenyl-diphosphatase